MPITTLKQCWNIFNFRYFKVLVQEMSLKVDQGFLNNIIDFFTSSQQVSSDQEVGIFSS